MPYKLPFKRSQITSTTLQNFNIEEGKLTLAEWLPSPNFNQRPAGTNNQPDIWAIVIHNISLPLMSLSKQTTMADYVKALFANQLIGCYPTRPLKVCRYLPIC